ncbi:MAG: hypothetical protein IJE70_07260 [Oscillospiraceae bacterium]|nr:hypothetical protein [Oscillospiraceae bacterium]
MSMGLQSKEKAMIVNCHNCLCVYHKDGVCSREKINLTQEGLCGETIDRMKYNAFRLGILDKE